MLFQAEGIGVTFGGLRALEDVSFAVEQHEIFAIVGPNGAGKTTALNCISRFYDVTTGRLVFKGRDITRVRPHAIADLGIARTFQNIELFKNTTVVQNLLLGRHRHRRSSLPGETVFLRSVRRQEIESRERVETVIDFLNLQAFRDQVVSSLPFGVQKTVELGRALAMEPELLLLDEPSSGLNPEESEDLSFWMNDIKEELGITIVLVEHNMRLVKAVSDRVLALNFGHAVTLGTPAEALQHPEVIAAYLGDNGGTP